MSASCCIAETLNFIFKSKDLFDRMKFIETSKQDELFKYLKGENQSLYGNLDSDLRTIFLRQTGDNFRAAKHFPTEQLFFNVL